MPILCSMFQCSSGLTRLLAAMVPDAATAGSPIPGNVQSLRKRNALGQRHGAFAGIHEVDEARPHPTASSPLRAVFWKGNTLCPATMPGPAQTSAGWCLLPACQQLQKRPTTADSTHRMSLDAASKSDGASMVCQPSTWPRVSINKAQQSSRSEAHVVSTQVSSRDSAALK